MFLVVSRLDVHFGFDQPIFLRVRSGMQVKLRTRNIGRLERSLSAPECGTETISYLAPKIWSLIPKAIKSSKSLDAFKSKIRQCEPDCPCRLYKTYLRRVGFI